MCLKLHPQPHYRQILFLRSAEIVHWRDACPADVSEGTNKEKKKLWSSCARVPPWPAFNFRLLLLRSLHSIMTVAGQLFAILDSTVFSPTLAYVKTRQRPLY